MKKLSTTGFTIVETLLVLILLTAVGFAGYYVYHSQKNVAPKSSQTDMVTSATKPTAKTASKTDATAKWLTYTAKLGKFTLKYPQDWAITANTSAAGDHSAPDEKFELRSINGTVLLYTFSQYEDGWLGEPDDFYSCGTQSACTTYGVASITPHDAGTSFGKMYIVQSSERVTGNNNGVDEYTMHLYKPLSEGNMPTVGDNSPYHKLYSFSFYNKLNDSYYLWVRFPETFKTKSAAEVFGSDDAKTAMTILQSFRSL